MTIEAAREHDDEVPADAPLPFALRVVVAFCLLHGARVIGTAAAGAWTRMQGGGSLSSVLLLDALPYGLFLVCDALLASQVLLRARNALFWGALYFALLAVFGMREVVVDVDRWAEMQLWERIRGVASIAMDAGLVGAMLSRSSRRALYR
jgi:hypothetical protein